jgi:predicted nucleic acid-binding protein
MAEVYVLDCSVAAKWLLPEPDRAPALRLLEQYGTKEISLIAPDLLLAEFASLLTKRCRRKQMTGEQAREACNLMTRCSPRLFELRPRLSLAMDISLRYQISLWDSAYIALASEFDCACLTADRRLFRGSAGRHPSLRLLGMERDNL